MLSYIYIYIYIYNRDSHPWFLVRFILIGLWWSCYTNTLVPVLPLSVILSALSRIVCMLIWVNLILWHMSTIFCLFKLVYYLSFLFSTDYIWPIFHLNCIRWCTFTFLTDFGNRSQCCWRVEYISRVIISPTWSIRMCDWWHDSDVTYS